MKKFDQINVIPFIDIMLVLLAIVLLSASFQRIQKIEVALPVDGQTIEGKSQQTPRVISINADNQWFIDKNLVDTQTLEQEMRSWSTQQKVLLNIDKQASFEEFVKLSGLLKKYQINQVSVLGGAAK